jgi:hypothetical protein
MTSSEKKGCSTDGLQIASSDPSGLQNPRTAMLIGSTSLGNYLTDVVTAKEVQSNFCKH